MEAQVCLNPDCNSYGSEHPNCQCYDGMASGGIAGRFCDKKQAHQSGCQYAKGGQVEPGFSIAEDSDTHYTIKHAKGDTLKIAKAGLSKELLSQIQKFKKGGEVQSVADKFTEATGPYPSADASSEMKLASNDKNPPVVVNVGSQSQTPQDSTAASLDTESIPAQAAQQISQQPKKDSVGPVASHLPDVEKAYNTGIENVKSGAASEAAAQTAISEQSVKAHEQEINALNDIQTKYQNVYNHASSEQEKLAKEIQDSTVDFHRLWHNAGTGNKILAGIGIALSGMGSGLTGQPNLALKVINDAIDRDIAEQKENLGKKKTALSAYNEILQNADHSAQLLKSVAQAGVVAQLNKITSSQGGTMAKAKQQLLLGEMLPKMEAEKFNYAVNRAKWEYDEDQATQQQSSQKKQEQVVPENLKDTDLGRTGQVNMKKLNHLVLTGIVNPEEAGKLRQEAQDFQMAQDTKKLAATDLSQMIDAVEKNNAEIDKNKKRMPLSANPLTHPLNFIGGGSDPLALLRVQKKAIGELPFSLGKPLSEGTGVWGGEIGRQYMAAHNATLTKVTKLLGARATPEIMKQIEEMLPERDDSKEEMKSKVARIMNIIDTNTSTINLEGRGLLR